MNKPYYDDQLAAAWMAQKFAIKFYDGNDVEYGAIVFDEIRMQIYYQAGCRGICQYPGWEREYNGRFYIRPDSLHILTAHLGDLTETWDGFSSQYKLLETEDDLAAYQAWGGDKFIILRNGVVFHHPKKE